MVFSRISANILELYKIFKLKQQCIFHEFIV